MLLSEPTSPALHCALIFIWKAGCVGNVGTREDIPEAHAVSHPPPEETTCWGITPFSLIPAFSDTCFCVYVCAYTYVLVLYAHALALVEV